MGISRIIRASERRSMGRMQVRKGTIGQDATLASVAVTFVNSGDLANSGSQSTVTAVYVFIAQVGRIINIQRTTAWIPLFINFQPISLGNFASAFHCVSALVGYSLRPANVT